MIIANGAPVRIEQDATITLEISSSFWIFSAEAMSRWRVWSDLRLSAISLGFAATMTILVGFMILSSLILQAPLIFNSHLAHFVTVFEAHLFSLFKHDSAKNYNRGFALLVEHLSCTSDEGGLSHAWDANNYCTFTFCQVEPPDWACMYRPAL